MRSAGRVFALNPCAHSGSAVLGESDSRLPPTVLATTGNVVTLKAVQDVLQPRQRSRAAWLSVPLLIAVASAFWVFRRPTPAIEHTAELPTVPAAAAALALTAAPLVAQQVVTPQPVATPVPVIESAAWSLCGMWGNQRDQARAVGAPWQDPLHRR